jgi:hypothetical protein
LALVGPPGLRPLVITRVAEINDVLPFWFRNPDARDYDRLLAQDYFLVTETPPNIGARIPRLYDLAFVLSNLPNAVNQQTEIALAIANARALARTADLQAQRDLLAALFAQLVTSSVIVDWISVTHPTFGRAPILELRAGNVAGVAAVVPTAVPPVRGAQAGSQGA